MCVQEKLSHEDLRLSPKKDINYFTTNIETLLDSLYGLQMISADEKRDKVHRICECIELEIGLKCLKTPVLEKKLIGHQILTQ